MLGSFYQNLRPVGSFLLALGRSWTPRLAKTTKNQFEHQRFKNPTTKLELPQTPSADVLIATTKVAVDVEAGQVGLTNNQGETLNVC